MLVFPPFLTNWSCMGRTRIKLYSISMTETAQGLDQYETRHVWSWVWHKMTRKARTIMRCSFERVENTQIQSFCSLSTLFALCVVILSICIVSLLSAISLFVWATKIANLGYW